MTRKRNNDKAWRAMLLLKGVRHPTIRAALVAHGFGPRHYEQGWKLMHELWPVDWSEEATPRRVDHRDIDAWENRWFPVMRVSLAARYPQVHDFVFGRIRQTEGLEVYFSVGEVVSRIRRLETEAPVEDAAAARALLAERGVTEAMLQGIEALMEAAWQIHEAQGMDRQERLRAERAAEDALWEWYLEWSTIVRTTVKDRGILRTLGFGGERSAAAQGHQAA